MSVLLSLPQIFASYKKWVAENPLKASDYEVTTKWVSYFIAGRINNSHILSELVYCVSNLLVLFNDRIITEYRLSEVKSSGDRLKLYLTVLEYCEVFLELSAKKIWGNTGKWLVVVSIQIFKCLSRLLLVYQHKEDIIQQPPVPILQRKDIKSPAEAGVPDSVQAQLESVCFNLKRSGKTIRKIDAAPPVTIRTWKPIERPTFDNEHTVKKALAGQHLVAETLYILKPIAHLGSLACFGGNTWKPWIVSLLFDLGSLHLYNSNVKNLNVLSKKQKLEISRRYIGLLLYLLRSPFYESHSKDRITSFLMSLSKNIPLAAMICMPLNKYIPFWQSNYFYMWST